MINIHIKISKMQSNQQYPQQPQAQPQQQQQHFQQQQQFPPQQQQPILVYPQYGQPQVFPRHAPSSTSVFAARSAVIMGSLQIVIGILCILFQAVAIVLESQVAVASSGIYCGILFIITGAFGVSAGKTKGQCLIVSFMVFCIISAAFTVAIFTTSSLGLGLDANHYPYHYYDNLDDIIPNEYQYDEYDGRKDYIDGWQGNVSNWMNPEPPRQEEPVRNWDSASSHNYEYNEHKRRGQLASNGILLILAMAELIIAICASALCCKALCCKGPRMQPQYAVPLVQYGSSTGQPQMMVMNMAPQQGMAYATPQPMVMHMQGGTVVQMSSTTPRVMTTTTAPPSGNQGGSTPPPSYVPVDPSANVPYNAVAAGQLQAPPSEMKENKA